MTYGAFSAIRTSRRRRRDRRGGDPDAQPRAHRSCDRHRRGHSGFLDRSVRIAVAAGVPEDRIVLDPGIGFGKTPEQSLRALAALGRLKALGFPVLLGVSRKSFIGRLFEPPPPPAERGPGTLAANVYGALHGADIVRVHDVAATVQALRVLDAIRRAA